MSTGTSVEKKSPQTLKEYIEVKRPEIASMLPNHVNVERFLKSAMLAVARDKNLQECTPLSLFTAVVNAAELGLDFTPARGHAYLVKYGNKAQMMPGYRGMIDLAKRTGDVSKIEAHLVHDNDKFEMEFGTNSRLIHVPEIRKPRGEMIGVYAVAHFNDGTSQFEYMTKAQVDAIRSRSKAKNSGPWVTDYEEMARKTVVRRLFKYLPSSSDMLDKAIEADNKAVGFEEFEMEPMADGDKTSNLAESLKGKGKERDADDDTEDAEFEDVPEEPADEPTGEPAEPAEEPEDYRERIKEIMKTRPESDLIEAKEALDISKKYIGHLTQEEAKLIVDKLEG